MENSLKNENYLKNVLTLAYLGDSVFSVMVRKGLVDKYKLKPSGLNKKANQIVSAHGQAEIMRVLKDNLTDDELDIAMRARNSHLNKAKNSTLEEYSLATQLEALVGYWFLNKQENKLKELFENFIVEKLW